MATTTVVVPPELEGVIIGRGTFSALSDLSTVFPAFAAGAYSRLRIFIRIDAGSTFTNGVYALTGATGTYRKQTMYALGGASAGIVTAANWNNDDLPGAPSFMDGWIDIRTGGLRDGVLDVRHENGGTPVWRHIWVSNDDTTNAITRFTMTFTGGTATGYAELRGLA